MEAIQTFFGNIFILVALCLGLKFAYQTVISFGKRDIKATFMALGEFLLCVVAVAGIYDWIHVGKSVSPDIADVLEEMVRFGLDSIKSSVIAK